VLGKEATEREALVRDLEGRQWCISTIGMNIHALLLT